MAMLQKQPTSGFGKPPRTWHWNWWLEFRRIVEGPVSSGTLGGPAMFVVTLIVELAVDDGDNDSNGGDNGDENEDKGKLNVVWDSFPS